ncbi:MalY/PatB family protein [Macrococcus armenti]|uniref:MalY/PatB family protein n=1 Tax=Macrococcus armenti TaxID=2875764 RepID=UPI001CCC35E4|nr:aminotransferase class I/II-fold pyridoxal phosphate-dependent enzyme [Macrococcus armenti]UBH07991.1 aminotransferase class I/II-fold pyridoxal phosphate-dependent enzyme [Macrococcus armenti]UBH10223.1 aminotransferase class I/II-fold pyridoxal phosphate-dependent enzyme [Macrococcus armenti]
MNFNAHIDRSATNAVAYELLSQMYQRKDLMPFWIADMDIATPEVITKALQKRLEHPIYGYTNWNNDQFYMPIRHWFSTRFNINVLKQDIAYSPSVLFTVTEVIRSVTNEGDGVIVNVPSYNNFLNLIQGNKRMIVGCDLFDDEDQYSMDFVQFEYLCQMPQNKVFLFCNPHNPTGKVFREEEILKIIEICQKHDVYIISDEIHMDFVRRGVHRSLIKYMSDYDKIIVTTCLGKTFNISGIPHAYYVTKDHYIKKLLQTKVAGVYGIGAPNMLGLTAIRAAYMQCGEWVDALNAHIETNMQLTETFIQERLNDVLSFRKPDGTFLAWINFEKSGFSEVEVQDALQNEGRIATGIGNTYEMAASTHFRLNVACSKEKLMKGLQAIEKAFNHLKSEQN